MLPMEYSTAKLVRASVVRKMIDCSGSKYRGGQEHARLQLLIAQGHQAR
jgi:hypothetical protein